MVTFTHDELEHISTAHLRHSLSLKLLIESIEVLFIILQRTLSLCSELELCRADVVAEQIRLLLSIKIQSVCSSIRLISFLRTDILARRHLQTSIGIEDTRKRLLKCLCLVKLINEVRTIETTF